MSRRDQRGHEVRRLRDLLRSGVQRLPAGAELPAESELMSAYSASRNQVRDALAMLRIEGLIERRQGLGTHTVASSFVVRIEEAHGAAAPAVDSMLNRRLRPRVITSAVVPLPPHAADRLEAAAGQPSLLLEYVNLLGDEPIALATNYVLAPEAHRIAATPFDSDWYALLTEAGCPLGDSQFVWGAVLSDSTTAPLLGIEAGRPLLSVEQVVHDPQGRPFDLAYIQLRADRWRFVSRFWREPGNAAR